MTLLVARQCRPLRAPRGAVGALPRLQRSASRGAARSRTAKHKLAADAENKTKTATPKPLYGYRKLSLNEYKQHQRPRDPVTPSYAHSDIVPVDSAILIPASVTATPEHFVDKIEPVPASLVPNRNLVVFLVTPSFAPWLLDDRVFLHKALDRLYENLSTPTPIVHALCAVVNKLPPATPFHDPAIGQEIENRLVSPPVNETGFEGIAYVTLPAKAKMSALPQLSGELGCIDFLVHTHTLPQGRRNDRIRVPLANTIFQTGESSTLINSTWERRSDGTGFQMRSRTVRQAAAINLSAEDPKPPNLPPAYIHQEAPALSIPLVPLTSPRQVDGHMGNIIRGVIGPDGNRITASTELEQLVPQYFKARGESAQATSAWALVIPKAKATLSVKRTAKWLRPDSAASAVSEAPDAAKDLPRPEQEEETQESWQAFWQKDPPHWSTSIQELISSGARLHKVLSGGGGWGKKAGLLSLDPVPFGAPAPQKETSNGDEADNFDSVSDFSTALKPVVQDGDFIQFFVSPKVTQTQHVSTFEHLKSLEKSAPKHVWNWEFGVVPSTVDSIPGGSWQHATAPSQEMIAFRGSFGALTEGGLTLMRGLRANPRTGLAHSLGTTSIDVPFSRWSAIRLFPKTSRAKEAGSSTSTGQEVSNTEPEANTDSIHDAPILTVSSQHASATSSSPFLTSRRPHNKHAPTASSSTARAKSTFAMLRDLYVKREPEQGTESVARHANPNAKAQTKRSPKPKITPPKSFTSPPSEEPATPLLRKVVPKEPDQFVVRRLIANTETTGPTGGKSRKKEAVSWARDTKTSGQREAGSGRVRKVEQMGRELDGEALKEHKEEGKRKEAAQEKQKAWRYAAKQHREGRQKRVEIQKQKRGHFTIRKVLAAPPSDANTRTERAKLNADEVIERTRVSGKTLARLTEQLKLITGLKGSGLSTLSRWRRRTKTQSQTPTSTPRTNRRRNLIRQVKPQTQNKQAPGSTPPSSLSQPNLTAHQRRAPHSLDFTMRSIPLTRPTHTNSNHALPKLYAHLRSIIHHTRLLNLQISSLLPNTPIPISKHAAKPLNPPFNPLRRKRARPARRTATRVRKTIARPHALSMKMRRGGAWAEGAGAGTSGRLRVRKFETVGLRVRRLRSERKRALEDEVEAWLGGGGGV